MLLIVTVPPTPSSLRVRVWRRLRALGAVPLKRTVHLLPDRADHLEQFQWLAQEVQRAGGEATLVRVARIENMTSADVIRLFQDARNPEYVALAARYRKALQDLEKKTKAASQRVEAEVLRLGKDYERIRELDFFDAPGRAEVERLREAIDMKKRPTEGARRLDTPRLDLRGLRGRKWITRPRPHVDRVASAWLIKRFIDPEATFLFAEPGDFPSDAIPFDTPGADLSHDGDDCTFETLQKQFKIRDRRVSVISEIIHDADIADGKFGRKEGYGIDEVLKGWARQGLSDRELLDRGMQLIEGLYHSLS